MQVAVVIWGRFTLYSKNAQCKLLTPIGNEKQSDLGII